MITHKVSPSRGARGLAIFTTAIHDASLQAARYGLSQRIASLIVAVLVLAYLFPSEEAFFTQFAQIALKHATFKQSEHTDPLAIALAEQVAAQAIAHAERDGAQYGWTGERLHYYGENRRYGPGTWEPTAPYFYYPPDEPFAPYWRPWVLNSAKQFRPQPLMFGTPAYMSQLNEVIQINQQLSDEERAIALKWVDGRGSVTPPGKWNQIAMGALKNSNLTEIEASEMFALLNVALADCFISAWDTKYAYWTTRPVTAAKLLLNIEFKPATLTPPFPSFISGHATFSSAAAVVLGHYFPLEKEQLHRLAIEAAHSRLLGGIHFRFDNEAGFTVGQHIGHLVLQHFNKG